MNENISKSSNNIKTKSRKDSFLDLISSSINTTEKLSYSMFSKRTDSSLKRLSSSSMENLKTNFLYPSSSQVFGSPKNNNSNSKQIEIKPARNSICNFLPFSDSSTVKNNNLSSAVSTKTIITSFNEKADEIKSKESYCKQWVLKHGCDKSLNKPLNLDEDTMNKDAKISKSPSNKHIDDDYLAKMKAEENIQREYLINLLKHLENEQNQQDTLTMDEVQRKEKPKNFR